MCAPSNYIHTVYSFLTLDLLTCRRILDVIRMAVERKPEDKIRSALLCKVPKSYKDKTFKEKDFISDGKLSSMLKVWWPSFILNLMLKVWWSSFIFNLMVKVWWSSFIFDLMLKVWWSSFIFNLILKEERFVVVF